MSKVWTLINLDTGDKLEGQYIAEDLSEDIGNTFSDKWALNRQHPITQFVHGDAESVRFSARFVREHTLQVEGTPEKQIELLKKWVRIDSKFKRPNICMFFIGDSHFQVDTCLIEKLGAIVYHEPNIRGQARMITFQVTLKKWYPYLLQTNVKTKTRYHNARSNDYYEMLCQREYGAAGLGDIIRKAHPDQPFIQVGQMITLPSAHKLKFEKVSPNSIPLTNAFADAQTVTRARREEMVEARGVDYTMHVWGEG